MHHEQVAEALGVDFEGWFGVVGEVVESAEEIAGGDGGAEFDEGFPDAVAGAGNVGAEFGGGDEAGWRGAEGADGLDGFGEELIVAEDVADAFVGVADADWVGGFACAELAADGDFAERFGVVGEEAGAHGGGVDEEKRGIEESGDGFDFGGLSGVVDGMEGGAEGEGAFASTGMDVDDDAAEGEDLGGHEVGDAGGEGAVGVAGEGAVHVDVVEGGDALVGAARAFRELGHEDDAAVEGGWVNVSAEALDGDLAFVFVAVGAAEDENAIGVWAESAVDDGEGDEGVAPGSVEVELDLVVGRAGAVEVDRVGFGKEGSHCVQYAGSHGRIKCSEGDGGGTGDGDAGVFGWFAAGIEYIGD